MLEGIEKEIWFVYKLGAKKIGVKNYSEYMEPNSEIRKSKRLSTRKLPAYSTLNIPEINIFSPTFPYLEYFRNNIFSLFKTEMEEALADMIKLYR